MLFPLLSFVLSLMCLCQRPVLERRGPLQVSLGRGGHHRAPVPEPGPHRMDVFSVDGWFLNGGRNFWQPWPAAQEAWWRLLDVLCCHCSACPLASRAPSGVVGQEGAQMLQRSDFLHFGRPHLLDWGPQPARRALGWAEGLGREHTEDVLPAVCNA